MKGYKNTEFGLIPNDWEIKTLGEIAEINKGIQLNSSLLNKENGANLYPCLNGGILPSGYTDNFNVLANTISISEGGNSCGYVNFNKQNFWAGGHCYYLYKVKCKVEFLYLILKFFEKNIMSLRVGTGLPNIQKKAIENFRILLPKDIKEQEKIARILDDIDELIQNTRKLIDKKKNLKIATMSKLLNPKPDWEIKTLGEILDYEQPTKYLVKSEEYCDGSKTPVLTAGKTFVLGYTNEEFGIYNNLPVIIFDDFTTDSKYVNFEFKAKSSAMKMLKLKNKNFNLYVIYCLMQKINFLALDHKRHWLSQYQYFRIPLPSIREQEKIARILDDIDEEIRILEFQLEKYKNIKISAMQDLLSAKVRV